VIFPRVTEVEHRADGGGPEGFRGREVPDWDVDLDDRRGGQVVQPDDDGAGCVVVGPPDRFAASVAVEVPEAAGVAIEDRERGYDPQQSALPAAGGERTGSAQERHVAGWQDVPVDLGGTARLRTWRPPDSASSSWGRSSLAW
jgi:hypothetical protein